MQAGPPHGAEVASNDQEKETFSAYDIGIEHAVLASILRDSSIMAEVAAELEPRDFFLPINAKIFEIMLVLDELEKPISVLSVRALVKNDPLYAEATKVQQDAAKTFEGASMDYVEAIAYEAASARQDVAQYCRMIVDYRIHRDALEATWAAYHKLEAGELVDTALDVVRQVGDDLVQRAQSFKGPSSIGHAVEELARDAEANANGTRSSGCTTGSLKLDKLIGGYHDENLIIIAGRPGMGKSILGTTALTAAVRILDAQGNRVYDPTSFSLEMSARENAARMIAEMDYDDARRQRRQPLTFRDIIQGRLNGDQWERFILLGQELSQLGIDVFDEGKMTMGKIASLARARAARSKRKPLIVIDHLQIVGAGDRYKGNRVEELTQITGEAKALAKRLRCPVIALSQLNRSVESREDKRPNLGDLRESGSIEQDADVVLMVYRPAYYLRKDLKHARAVKNSKRILELEDMMESQSNTFEVDAAKNRNGPVGDVKLWIDVASSAVRDYAPGEEPDPQPQMHFGDPLDALADLDKRTGP